MYPRQTALIIGAGLGGIAAAAHLARSGYGVTVLEKNSTPGGRCSQLIRDGHRFDIGATLLLMPELYAETYAALGERMEDYLDLRRVDPMYRLHFDDGTQLVLTADINEMQSQLKAIEPGSFGAYLRYLVESYRHFHLTHRLIKRNFYSLPQYLSPGNLCLLFKLNVWMKHYDSFGNYSQHPHLKAAFTFQNMYLGINPFDAPATYSLLQCVEFADSVWLPVGGMYSIVESLVSNGQAHGARFVYNTPAKQIEVDGRRATGVILHDVSRLSADLVVANADLPYVYRHLLPDKADADRMMRLEYTCSKVMFYWGVDRVYLQLATYNLVMAGDYRGSFERILRGTTLPDEPNFYVHAPARTDPSAAPSDQDTLMVLVPAGHLDDAIAQDWDALPAGARSAILRRLAEMGLTDLEKHLKFEVTCTPRNWADMYNLTEGAALGSVGHSLLQVGYLRPHNRHRRYGNLYFAGSSTHPGGGLPMALLSARLTTERILKEVGSPRSG